MSEEPTVKEVLANGFADKATIGQKYGPAMEIAEPTVASRYFERCVEHTLRVSEKPVTREEAESIERSNLGYYAGYYDHKTRRRVERLFSCHHPVFGVAK